MEVQPSKKEEAGELLYGSCRRGLRMPRSNLVEQLANIAWQDYIITVADILANENLISWTPAERLRQVVSYDNRSPRRYILSIEGGDYQLLATPTQFERSRGLGLELSERRVLPIGLADRSRFSLNGGSQQVKSAGQIQDLLSEPCREQGLSFIDNSLSGREIISIADRGFRVEFTDQLYPYKGSSAQRRHSARLVVVEAASQGSINDQERRDLEKLISDTDPEGDILLRLLDDRAGRVAIVAQRQRRIRTELR